MTNPSLQSFGPVLLCVACAVAVGGGCASRKSAAPLVPVSSTGPVEPTSEVRRVVFSPPAEIPRLDAERLATPPVLDLRDREVLTGDPDKPVVSLQRLPAPVDPAQPQAPVGSNVYLQHDRWRTINPYKEDQFGRDPLKPWEDPRLDPWVHSLELKVVTP